MTEDTLGGRSKPIGTVMANVIKIHHHGRNRGSASRGGGGGQQGPFAASNSNVATNWHPLQYSCWNNPSWIVFDHPNNYCCCFRCCSYSCPKRKNRNSACTLEETRPIHLKTTFGRNSIIHVGVITGISRLPSGIARVGSPWWTWRGARIVIEYSWYCCFAICGARFLLLFVLVVLRYQNQQLSLVDDVFVSPVCVRCGFEIQKTKQNCVPSRVPSLLGNNTPHHLRYNEKQPATWVPTHPGRGCPV